MFFRLLLESFRHQRRRKLLAGVAILLGTTAVTAMLALATTIGDRIHQELAVYGANIVVTPKASALDVKVGGVDLKPATGNASLHESDLAKLRGIFWANNITGISPELTGPVTLRPETATKGGSEPQVNRAVTLRGLWFDHTLQGLKTGAPALHPWWKLSGSWPSSTAGPDTPLQVVAGAALATSLHLHQGDGLRLSSAGRIGVPAEVVGIVSAGDRTDTQLLLSLDAAQFLLAAPDAVDRVEVSARTRPEDAFARKDPDTLSPKQRDLWYCRPYANSIAYQIGEAIPGARAEQLRQVEQNEGAILSRISGLLWLVSAAALVAAGFAVSAAMATAILERRGEIGLMRSLGASRGSIALLFYVESAVLAVLAGTVGYLAGSLLSAWLGARVFSGAGAHALTLAAINPVLLPIVLSLALAVALAGSTPSIRAALRLDPSTVLRADA